MPRAVRMILCLARRTSRNWGSDLGVMLISRTSSRKLIGPFFCRAATIASLLETYGGSAPANA